VKKGVERNQRKKGPMRFGNVKKLAWDGWGKRTFDFLGGKKKKKKGPKP